MILNWQQEYKYDSSIIFVRCEGLDLGFEQARFFASDRMFINELL